jgi:hypothetical protein
MHATESTVPASRQNDVSRENKQVSCAEQIEFEFAAAVTTAPQKKRRRRAATPRAKSEADESEIRTKGSRDYRNKALSEDSQHAAFGDDWIDNACSNILSARDLREAVALSASYLAELIDLEVEKRGYCDDWKQAYSAYCSTQLYSFTPEEDETLSVPGHLPL